MRERMLFASMAQPPAGRAAAVVEKLRETAMERCYPGDCARPDILHVIEEATTILQDEVLDA